MLLKIAKDCACVCVYVNWFGLLLIQMQRDEHVFVEPFPFWNVGRHVCYSALYLS